MYKYIYKISLLNFLNWFYAYQFCFEDIWD